MCSHCGGSQPNEKISKKQRKDKGKHISLFNSSNSDNKFTACNFWKPSTCFRCGSEDHFITNCPKLDTSDKKFYWNTENPKTCVYRLTEIYNMLDKRTDQSESQKINAYMSRMYSNAEGPTREFGYSSQLTNWILDSCATCHMTPDIFYFIPGSFMETDKYIEVADGNFVTEKQTG